MRLILALALLLMASTAWAGPEFLTMVGADVTTITANSINGISSISSSGTMDTGTGSGGASGDITVAASCTGGTGAATVYLVVTDIGGTRADFITCDWGAISDTLTATVTAPYTARIYGTKSSNNTFTAGPFTFPQ